IAEWLGYSEAGRHRCCIVPEFRTLLALVEGGHNRSATRGLRRNHPWPFGANTVYGREFLKSLPHADQANAAARGINDDVRQLAAEFLPELISHGLLALDAVRLLECRDFKPASVRFVFRDEFSAVGDQSINQSHVCTECARLQNIGYWGICRHRDYASKPRF